MIRVTPEAPNSSDTSVLRQAEALRRAGKFNAARRLLEELGPEAGLGARILLARLLAQTGELDSARRLYGQVLKEDPDNLPALRALATGHLAAGRWDEAEGHLDRWDAVDPGDPEQEDLREELALARREEESTAPAELPGGEHLEDVLTRPDEASPPSALLLEGELLPAPSLGDAEAWDLGDDWEDPPAPEGP